MSDDQKHTLGPWEIFEDGGYFDVFTPQGIEIVGCEGCANEANAKLIAAAPDLLEALEAYVEALFDGPENLTSRRNDELEEKARNAIAKAKGGAK